MRKPEQRRHNSRLGTQCVVDSRLQLTDAEQAHERAGDSHARWQSTMTRLDRPVVLVDSRRNNVCERILSIH